MTEQEAIENALNGLKNADIKIDDEIRYPSIKALEEIQQYKAIGGTPEMLAYIINFIGNDEDNSIINDLELLNQYRILGTVEELKEAKEKQIPKKPVKRSFIVPYEGINVCPSCKEPLPSSKEHHCKCGQKLDWGNEDAE